MDLTRYQRQMRLDHVGTLGQQRWLASTATIVGCGALGGMAAMLLVRAGVGHVRLIDRDFVEWTNLPRQVLFDEEDARQGYPKAEAAAAKLRVINSQVKIEAIVDDLSSANAETLLSGRSSESHVIVDGLDNYQTRFLLNDLATKYGWPLIHGGAVAQQGSVYAYVPERNYPCLRCLFGDAPLAGGGPTCDSVGVWSPLVTLVASWQASLALSLLMGQVDRVPARLMQLDMAGGLQRSIDAGGAGNPDCPCCRQHRYDYLQGNHDQGIAILCGQQEGGAVQIIPPSPLPPPEFPDFLMAGNEDHASTARKSDAGAKIDLREMARRLAPLGKVRLNPMLLQVELVEAQRNIRLAIFPNGRAIIQGTSDITQAKAIYARYVGM